MKKDLKVLCKGLMRSTAALAIAFVVAAACFAWWGSVALAPMTASLSEVAMEQGARREAAGEQEEARRFYEQALAGKFHGEANQNHCEKRLGVVLLELGDLETALTHLERAQASPLRSLNGYGPLVEVLMKLERWKEARGAAERWLDESKNDPANRADAHQALGRIATHEGDLDRAGGHLNEALAIDSKHPALGDLARLYAARGDIEKTRDTMIAYLASAPLDDDTAANWAALETWMPRDGTTCKNSDP
jgi:tetratricopeptide (TPR) repeat protein